MHNIEANSRTAVNLAAFNQHNYPMVVDRLELTRPKERQYVLRMPIRRYYSGFWIPKELEWCWPLIQVGFEHQKLIKINHAFAYLTVRSGIVDSQTDDEWHTDGFSTRITHLPEQNYIWSDTYPTEYVVKPIQFPCDFNPLRHNVHKYVQSMLVIGATKCWSVWSNCVYCLDPYVIHRRPKEAKGKQRTFVRLSFTPIEILDKNNTPNPLLPVPSTDRDGVEIRNELEEY
jgi:hypothetical protein